MEIPLDTTIPSSGPMEDALYGARRTLATIARRRVVLDAKFRINGK